MLQLKEVFIFSLFFLYPLSSQALSNDDKEKIHIVAEHTQYNYKTGVAIFEGNVKLDQGTSHVTADKVITKNNAQHQIEEATAYGVEQLAHYWTLHKIGDPEVHAHAKIIKLYPGQSNVMLQNQASIAQGNNHFKGQLIFYNRNNQTITVPASKDSRAVLIYDPEN